jgi:hypothetical protein
LFEKDLIELCLISTKLAEGGRLQYLLVGRVDLNWMRFTKKDEID